MTQEIREWDDPSEVLDPIEDSFQVVTEERAHETESEWHWIWHRVMLTYKWPAVTAATARYHATKFRGGTTHVGTGTGYRYVSTMSTPSTGDTVATLNMQSYTDTRYIDAGTYFQVWGQTAYLQDPDPTIYKTTALAWAGVANTIWGTSDVYACCYDQANTIYYTRRGTSNTINSVRIDSTQHTVIKTLTSAPRGIAVDRTAGKIYWLEDTPALKVCDLDGGNTATLLVLNASSLPRGLDCFFGNLYWADTWSDTINRCTTAGAGFVNLISGLSDPFGVKVNTKNGYQKIYISDPGDGKIKYANLDGTSLTDGITGLTSNLKGLDVDTSRAGAGVMYYVDGLTLNYWYISYFSPVVLYTHTSALYDVCVDRTRSVVAMTCPADGTIKGIGGDGENQAVIHFTPAASARWNALGASAHVYFFKAAQISGNKPNSSEMREITMELEYRTDEQIAKSPPS